MENRKVGTLVSEADQLLENAKIELQRSAEDVTAPHDMFSCTAITGQLSVLFLN